MKTKLLKRIRKVYSYRFDNSENEWIVCDHKNKRTFRKYESHTVIAHYLYQYWGIHTGLNYESHIAKREAKVRYLNELKKCQA